MTAGRTNHTAFAAPAPESSRSQKMREAGFTARDTRLTCDECGAKFTRQFAPLHECAAPEPSAQGEPVAWRPNIKCTPEQNFNAGLPNQQTIDYWTVSEHNYKEALAVLRETLAAEITRLRAEAEALRKDAERYRYLRNRNALDVLQTVGDAAGCWIDCEVGEVLTLLTGDDADAAIDATKGTT